MKTLAIVLALGVAVSPALADTAPKPVVITISPTYLKSLDNPPPQDAPGKGDMPEAENMKVTAPRVPGGSDDCAATGGAAGPDGCTVLKQDANHYEWPTVE